MKMDRFIGQTRSNRIKITASLFCDNYVNLKSLVNGLNNNGKHDTFAYELPEVWEDRLLRVIPEIIFKGGFEQIWVIK